jgi:hypothetical protein
MKLNRKIFSISILLLIAFLPLQAQKKPPQTPLEELTDPASHNYVPYPYPETDFEIIEDFKYAVDLFLSPKSGRHTTMIKGYSDNRKQLLELSGKNPTLEVKKIIRVKDLVLTSPCLYFFLLQIEDKRGNVVAIGRLEDCGLYAGVAFVSDKTKFKPYKTEKQVENILTDALGHIEINKMERIGIHSSLPTDPYAPLWRISTSESTFFVDYFYDDVYKVVEEIPWTAKDNYPDPERKRNIILYDLKGKALFVVKINKK